MKFGSGLSSDVTEVESESEYEGPERLYSQKAIAVATFLGGPLAGGIMVRRNFLNLECPEAATKALVAGMVATAALSLVALALPDSIPSSVVPGIYIGIVYQLVGQYQGKALKRHEQCGQVFYSGWKTFGVGMASMLVTAGVLFGAYFQLVVKPYDEQFAQLQTHEREALALYDKYESATPEELVEFIDNIGLPAWRACDANVEEMNKIAAADDELLRQNQKLSDYVDLRIECYILIRKGLVESSSAYDAELEELSTKIDGIEF